MARKRLLRFHDLLGTFWRYGAPRRLRVALLLLGAFSASWALAGCQSGPGAKCDDCAVAEAKPVGDGAQAAAASASGGQRAEQAPFADDRGRLAPVTAVGRGAGDTSNSSSNAEQRSVASGGAQNLGVNLPTSAEASTGAGGLSPSVLSAGRTVEAYRASLQLALMAQPPNPDMVRFLSEQLAKAQETMAMVEAGTRAVVNNTWNQDHQSNTITGVSKATSGEPNKEDPETVKALGAAVSGLKPSASFPEPVPPAEPATAKPDGSQPAPVEQPK